MLPARPVPTTALPHHRRSGAASRGGKRGGKRPDNCHGRAESLYTKGFRGEQPTAKSSLFRLPRRAGAGEDENSFATDAEDFKGLETPAALTIFLTFEGISLQTARTRTCAGFRHRGRRSGHKVKAVFRSASSRCAVGLVIYKIGDDGTLSGIWRTAGQLAREPKR